ncbi:MAG: acyl-CoA/acyl-ACP dehydrogenase [Actinomycetota bacterium]|nr:acyl-CoA/acyl-ACP dehydrogenase [Actinomycetota bacterium]
MPSLLATPALLAREPAVGRAQELADRLLTPRAQQVDAEGVPLTHVHALRDAGLIGLAGPADAGGGAAAPAVARAVTETLSGACGNTWFVLTQHALPLAMTVASGNPAVCGRYLRPLATGESLAGVAVAHVRRPRPPAVTARPAGDGWSVDGTVGWFTSWGLADVFLLGAQAGDDLVFFLVDAQPQRGLSAGGELPLAAMGGTHTTTLQLSGLQLGADRVVDVVPREQWLASDATKTANVTPAVFGLLRAVVAELVRTAERRGSAEAADLAAALDAEGGSLRAEAYRLIDEVPAGEAVDRRLALRATACELTVRAAAALIAAQAGAAMLLSSPAQRWAREALFHQVQAQTAAVRAAQLRRYAEVGR